jgi:hypothetical protein
VGFADADRETLLVVRRNLLHGLNELARHADAGTLYATADGAHSPPVASGWLIVVLLDQVNAELHSRPGAAVVPAR